MLLGQIVASKKEHISRLKGAGAKLETAAASAPPIRDFHRVLQGSAVPAIIAEIKKASPSAGLIRPGLDVKEIALEYERAGAAAISVITEERYFLGGMHFLTEARAATSLPVLCKDFLVDPVQILEARAAGADAVLLIMALLDDGTVGQLLELSHSLGMACLMEVHDEHELNRALATHARIIGINNRNLQTFQVNLENTLRLRPLVPTNRLVVSESGIHRGADLERLAAAGVQAVLIGTTLMRAANPGEKLRELRGA